MIDPSSTPPPLPIPTDAPEVTPEPAPALEPSDREKLLRLALEDVYRILKVADPGFRRTAKRIISQALVRTR